jgi:lycopene beta-cyclase
MDYYDYIIVGGGASGLMMAYRMSNDAFFDDKSILILDKEKKNTNDRTWCYWGTENDEWNELVRASWKHIIFKSELHTAEETIAPYQYKMIRSADFYAKIWMLNYKLVLLQLIAIQCKLLNVSKLAMKMVKQSVLKFH